MHARIRFYLITFDSRTARRRISGDTRIYYFGNSIGKCAYLPPIGLGLPGWCRVLFPYLLPLTGFRGSCFMTEGTDVTYFWRVTAARFNDMRSARYFSTCSGKSSANRISELTSRGMCHARARGNGYRSECRRVYTSVSDLAASACSLVNGTGGSCRDPAKE